MDKVVLSARHSGIHSRDGGWIQFTPFGASGFPRRGHAIVPCFCLCISFPFFPPVLLFLKQNAGQHTYESGVGRLACDPRFSSVAADSQLLSLVHPSAANAFIARYLLGGQLLFCLGVQLSILLSPWGYILSTEIRCRTGKISRALQFASK